MSTFCRLVVPVCVCMMFLDSYPPTTLHASTSSVRENTSSSLTFLQSLFSFDKAQTVEGYWLCLHDKLQHAFPTKKWAAFAAPNTLHFKSCPWFRPVEVDASLLLFRLCFYVSYYNTNASHPVDVAPLKAVLYQIPELNTFRRLNYLPQIVVNLNVYEACLCLLDDSLSNARLLDVMETEQQHLQRKYDELFLNVQLCAKFGTTKAA